MVNVMIWGRFRVHLEADENSMNLCQLILTHWALISLIYIVYKDYGKQNITSSILDLKAAMYTRATFLSYFEEI